MIKYIIASISLLLLMTCTKEENAPDCSAVLCTVQTVSVELVDENGNNLIANETYPLENIQITKGENPVNVTQLTQETEVQFFLSGNEGENRYLLKLNDSETDTLVLNLTKVSQGNECCSPTFKINGALYNDSPVAVISENNCAKLIVIKPQG